MTQISGLTDEDITTVGPESPRLSADPDTTDAGDTTDTADTTDTTDTSDATDADTTDSGDGDVDAADN